MTESNTIHSETYLLLKSLLAKAETPITGRGVATVIEMEDGRILEGYNIENSETDIIHAEISALNDLGPQDGSIKSIHLMASGSMADIKNCLPCVECAKSLSINAGKQTNVVLHPNDGGEEVSFLFDEINDAYQSYADVAVLNDLGGTLLTPVDKRLVEHIVGSLSSLDDSAKLYITGSASGRGGPKSLLAKKLTGVAYWDIDLLVIGDGLDARQTHEWFLDAYSQALKKVDYSFTDIMFESEPSYILEQGLQDSPDFIFRRIYWAKGMNKEPTKSYAKSPLTPSTVDLSVGKNLEATITPVYLANKWYARLE